MKAKHLTLEDRKMIQQCIEDRLSKTDAGRKLGKDPSTIAKEIKRHRTLKPRNRFNYPVVCQKANSCKHPRKPCSDQCAGYVEAVCLDRDRKVGACNHCPKLGKCKLDRFFYNASAAHESYLFHLSDSRLGVNLNESERLLIADTIKPLLQKGQSVYQILNNHPEINLSPKSLYTYIEGGIFKDQGIDNFSLRRQVSMKQRKKMKKRKQPANYDGHRYSDYLQFLSENPAVPTTEMDTVYNNPEGPFIQTFSIGNTGIMIGFLHQDRTS